MRVLRFGQLIHKFAKIIGRGENLQVRTKRFEGFKNGEFRDEVELGTKFFIKDDLNQCEGLESAGVMGKSLLSNTLRNSLQLSKGAGKSGYNQGGCPKRLGF